ncbi:hypothetical protein MRB53_041415 [Persea americana]|nr:hypothetical protein MRB53_041415 [Persea americana]
MDTKQLADTSKQIMKAVEGGDPASTILQLLQPLQKWNASEDALRQSKIGHAVNKLRQYKDPKVSELSSRLINKWKTDVSASKKKAPGSPALKAAKMNGTNGTGSGKSSPAPPPAKKELRKSTVEPEKRDSKSDGVDTNVTGNDIRDGPDEILQVARSIEVAAFNEYQPETSSVYKSKMRSLFMNLKIKGNVRLRKDVFNGNIAPKRFGVLLFKCSEGIS